MTQTRLPARAQDARAGSRIAHAQVRPAGGFHAAMRTEMKSAVELYILYNALSRGVGAVDAL